MITWFVVLCSLFLLMLVLGFLYDFKKEPVRSMAAGKHLLREYFASRSSIKYYVVVVLFAFAIGNQALWADEILLHEWTSFYGQIANRIYYPVEEWLALHSHNNEWPCIAPYAFMMSVIGIFFLLRKTSKIHGFGAALFLFVFFVGCLLAMPCLCRTKERVKRQFCETNHRIYLREFEKVTKTYPEHLPEIEEHFTDKLKYLYPGAGKLKSTSERFIVLEDAPRIHAGDLRHRLWSDGTIDSVYPWKTEEARR